MLILMLSGVLIVTKLLLLAYSDLLLIHESPEWTHCGTLINLTRRTVKSVLGNCGGSLGIVGHEVLIIGVNNGSCHSSVAETSFGGQLAVSQSITSIVGWPFGKHLRLIIGASRSLLLHHLKPPVLENGIHMESFGRAEGEDFTLDLGDLLADDGGWFPLVWVEQDRWFELLHSFLLIKYIPYFILSLDRSLQVPQGRVVFKVPGIVEVHIVEGGRPRAYFPEGEGLHFHWGGGRFVSDLWTFLWFHATAA